MVCYLSDLYVTPAWRRRGIAVALIRTIARAVKASGGRFLAWSTERENTGARALYDRIAEPGENLVPYISDGERFEALQRKAIGHRGRLQDECVDGHIDREDHPVGRFQRIINRSEVGLFVNARACGRTARHEPGHQGVEI